MCRLEWFCRRASWPGGRIWRTRPLNGRQPLLAPLGHHFQISAASPRAPGNWGPSVGGASDCSLCFGAAGRGDSSAAGPAFGERAGTAGDTRPAEGLAAERRPDCGRPLIEPPVESATATGPQPLAPALVYSNVHVEMGAPSLAGWLSRSLVATAPAWKPPLASRPIQFAAK